MAEYLIQGETLTAIGDAIRTKTGGTDNLSPAEMATAIEGIETSTGIELPTLTNPGIATDLREGRQLIDGEGNVVNGAVVTAHGGLSKNVLPIYRNTGSIPFISMAYEVGYPTYISPGTGPNIEFTTYAENFGTATADSVAKGNTFTSKEGVCIRGEAEWRTDNDFIYNDNEVVVPAGFYVNGGRVDTDTYYAKGLADGAEKVKTDEARDNSKVEINLDVPNTSVVVTAPSGYYADNISKEADALPIYQAGVDKGYLFGYDDGKKSSGYDEGWSDGWQEGYDTGFADGNNQIVPVLPTLTNPGTAADLLIRKQLIDGNGNLVIGTMPVRDNNDIINQEFGAIVPAGYYENEVIVDCEPQCDAAYDNGYDYGHSDGWQEGFEEGYHQGKEEGGGELHHLLLEQIQSENVVRINANTFCYDVSIFGSSIDYDSTFDDYVEREYSSLSSNPLTISVDNYSDFYLYLYLRVMDRGNDEQYLTTVIVPPGWNNSVDITTQVSMGERPDWRAEIIGARFTKYEL